MTDAEIALAALAKRVLDLESSSSVLGSGVAGTGTCAAASDKENAVLATTLEDLRKARAELAIASKEAESRAAEAQNLKKENGKLRYQVNHLLRSLHAEESRKF